MVTCLNLADPKNKIIFLLSDNTSSRKTLLMKNHCGGKLQCKSLYGSQSITNLGVQYSQTWTWKHMRDTFWATRSQAPNRKNRQPFSFIAMKENFDQTQTSSFPDAVDLKNV
jgi:hypothetical protein